MQAFNDSLAPCEWYCVSRMLPLSSLKPPALSRQDASGRYILYMYDSERQSLKDDTASSGTYRIGAFSGFHTR